MNKQWLNRPALVDPSAFVDKAHAATEAERLERVADNLTVFAEGFVARAHPYYVRAERYREAAARLRSGAKAGAK